MGLARFTSAPAFMSSMTIIGLSSWAARVQRRGALLIVCVHISACFDEYL